jgi:hypothetical protein
LVRQTRAISAKALAGFGNVQALSEETTVSKQWSAQGRVSASAMEKEISMDLFTARSRSTFNIFLLTSTAIIRQSGGCNQEDIDEGSFRCIGNF